MGTPCTKSSQCGTKACDPLSQTCQPSACPQPGQIVGASLCVGTPSGANVLLPSCIANESFSSMQSGCPASQECVAYGYLTYGSGYCANLGTGPLNAPCSGSENSTGCQKGLLCGKWNNGTPNNVCSTRCDRFGSLGQCPASERCWQSRNPRCEPPPVMVDPAILGAPCTSPVYCADDGHMLRGKCDGPPNNGPFICRPRCRSTADCVGGKACQGSGDDGVCR